MLRPYLIRMVCDNSIKDCITLFIRWVDEISIFSKERILYEKFADNQKDGAIVCGIAGIVGNNKKDYREIIPRMLECIKHRGPDDNGEYYFSNCALGHVRLSIIDLTNGHQPLIDGKALGLVFNGEIYGYKEIRKDLLQKNLYQFRSECDTEVILALYRNYGTDMMKYLPGMFAFAIWDDENKRLFCARDRFGEKPFYYAISAKGELIFASEIKAILASGMIRPRLDISQLERVMKTAYVYPTKCIYSNIHVLPPAHCLKFERGKVSVEPYWILPTETLKIGEDEACEEFSRLFYQAVKRQLVADVPVGAFLSGGLDTGTVVALASEFASPLTTISFSFKDGIDEGHLARSMAKKYNTNHIELNDLDFSIKDELFKMHEILDQPFGDSAVIPSYLISKKVREHVKVVLTGDGGDELLGGYDWVYRSLCYMKFFSSKKINILHYKKYLDKKSAYLEKVYKQKRRMGVDKSIAYLSATSIEDIKFQRQGLIWANDVPKDIAKFVRDGWKFIPDEWQKKLGINKDETGYVKEGLLEASDLDNGIRAILLDYLPGDGFYKTDSSTMAASLESRTPFCDLDLAEFCLRLPFDFKVRSTSGKYLLRKAFSDMWTETVRCSIKNGFDPPVDKWLYNQEMKEVTHYYLQEKNRKIFDFIPYDETQQMMDSGGVFYGVWDLLNVSIWLENHDYTL